MKRWEGPALAWFGLLGLVWGQPLLLQDPDTQLYRTPVNIKEVSEKVTWQFFVHSGSPTTDVCAALSEARKQQAMVLFAYQNPQVLQASEDSGLGWSGYSQAVENLVRRIYETGSIENFDFARDVGRVEVLLKPAPASIDPAEVQIVVVLETHSNGTIWGFDPQGNRVLLVSRGGTIYESSQELIIQAHKDHFGELAGEWLYFAHLDHEMKHRQQLLHKADEALPGLEEYQHNELEAYQSSIQSKEQALKANGCF